jgi:hypothetical protein
MTTEPVSESGPHPIKLRMIDDLRRSRLTVFFRLLIAVPHIVWYYLWSLLARIVAVLTWLCALVTGRPPRPFHRFLGSYVRYQNHFWAFLSLVGNPFPGFLGKRASYPVDLDTPAEPEIQHRLVTFFRLLLAIPAMLLSAALTYALAVVALLGWFVSLVRGRMPEGLRDLGAYILRYSGQVNAYVYLQTARYPHSSPRQDFAPRSASP